MVGSICWISCNIILDVGMTLAHYSGIIKHLDTPWTRRWSLDMLVVRVCKWMENEDALEDVCALIQFVRVASSMIICRSGVAGG